MPIFDMCVMPDLNEKFGEASLNDQHWYPVEKSVCTRRFDFSMGSLRSRVPQSQSERVPWSEVIWIHWDYGEIRIEQSQEYIRGKMTVLLCRYRKIEVCTTKLHIQRHGIEKKAQLHNKLCVEYYIFTINYMREK